MNPQHLWLLAVALLTTLLTYWFLLLVVETTR